MKKTITLSAIVILLSIAAYFFVIPDDELDSDGSNYTFVPIQRKDISQSVIATGIIKPKVGSEVKVGAQVSGIVKELYVEVGSNVKKNQLLAVIETDVYKAKAAQTLGLKEETGIEKKYAEIDLARSKSLYEQKVIPEKEFESALQRFERACAKLKQAEADHDYAVLQLIYTQIMSPINGVVASVSTQKGETVAASFSAPTFFTIIDLNRLELWAYVDETDIGRIKKGQKVSFTVDTYPGDSFEGIVETIYPKADIINNVVNYITVIHIVMRSQKIIRTGGTITKSSVDSASSWQSGLNNTQKKILRPEMTAAVEIFTLLKNNVLVVPKKAVQPESGKFYVNILKNVEHPVKGEGEIEKRNIIIGISDKKYYEIIFGLSEKEKVILVTDAYEKGLE